MADKNNSGTIDEGEFMSLFLLILQGGVKGLSNTSRFFGPSSKLKRRQSAFQETLTGMVEGQEGELVPMEEKAKIAVLFQAAVKRNFVDRSSSDTIASTNDGSASTDGGAGGGGRLSKTSFKKYLKDVIMSLVSSKDAVPRAEEMEGAFGLLADTPSKEGTVDESGFVAVVVVYLAKYRAVVQAKAKEKAAEKAAVAKEKADKLEEAKQAVRRQKSEKLMKDSSSSAAAAGGAEVESSNPLVK